jgi:hypothetical protein
MPADLKVGLMCPIRKKGALLECKNYRGITLPDVGYKIFSKVLYRKLEMSENAIVDSQPVNQQVTNF